MIKISFVRSEKKAQVGVVYLGLITLITLALAGITFVWFDGLKDDASAEFNKQHTENLLTYFERRLISMKTLADPPIGSSVNSSISIPVPQKIGISTYIVRGEDNDLIIEIPGGGRSQRTQTIFRKGMYWWNSSFSGGAHSAAGEVVFSYDATTGNITIS